MMALVTLGPSVSAVAESPPTLQGAAVAPTHVRTRIVLESLPRIHGLVKGFNTFSVSPTSVPHGKYKIVVRDTTIHHNWHIYGTGVNKRTSVAGTGRWVWRKRLYKGTYNIHCDVHKVTMHIKLKVT
jgi:hypothetical protein